ncbi:DCC1-like thiol-disulfide oxidoreductase family protein [Ruegeria sp. HKCCA6707]|uniref:DCC1-like thiol-disulfide oxidoreductase family protein n=1 Tax=unclassified Ruegeria TaxID=2625375 RepID=UPI00352D9512
MTDETVLIYDGDCPFCSRYVAMVRLKEAIGPVNLVDARNGGDVVEQILAKGLDLDDGMVLLFNGDYYHGAECIHRLALLSTRSGLFNRLNALVFRSPTMSRVLYPVLRFGRNTVLRLLGRQKISA